MFEVDRLVAVIKPKEKMLAFLRSQPNAGRDLTLETVRNDCTALLIPAYESPKMARGFIEKYYPGIFENELEAWGIPENEWPKDRDLAMFDAWFDVEFHSIVYDIAELETDNQAK